MVSKTIALALAVAGVASARKCQDFMIPISISAENSDFPVEAPTSNIEVTEFFLNLTQRNRMMGAMPDAKTVSGDYHIAATYCAPTCKPSGVLEFLTHGAAFDRVYWDVPLEDHRYSYVEAATARGHATFAWDRLGISMSSHGNPVSEIQTSLELAALAKLTEMLRAGEIEGIDRKFDSVVHVGHSYGSALSAGLAAARPELTDGIVLTGFSASQVSTANFILGGGYVLANTLDRFKDYADGYVANGDKTGLFTDFLGPDNFSPEALDFAFATSQPVAVGEFLSLGQFAQNAPYDFSKPVLVITGDRDLAFCGGNCMAPEDPSMPNIPASVKNIFPKASPFNATVVPKAGHGLNYGYSAPWAYDRINDFLEENHL